MGTGVTRARRAAAAALVLALSCGVLPVAAPSSAPAQSDPAAPAPDSAAPTPDSAAKAPDSAGVESTSAAAAAASPSDSLVRALDTDPRGIFETVPPEPVYLGGSVLLVIRDSLGYPTARARAQVIRRRLLTLARSDLPLDSIRSEPTAVGARILAGSATVAQITWDDLPPGETRTPAELARAMVPELRAGIERERKLFQPVRLATSAVLTAVLGLAYLALAWVLWTRGRQLARIAGAKAAHVVGAIQVRGVTLLHRRAVASAAYRATLFVLTLALLLLGYALLSYAFSLFPWTQGWGARLGSFAFDLIGGALSAAMRALPGIFLALLVLLGFRVLIRFVSRLLDRVGAGRLVLPGLHPELVKPTKLLVRIFLWVAAIVIVYPLIPGSDSPAFKGVSILLGVVVSLGSTGLVENLLAGLVLTYARSYRLGERIGTGEIIGDVANMGLLTTKVLTIKNEVVTLGNAQILRGSVKNYSRQAAEGPGLILHTSVTIGYDTPWRTVHALLIEAADATEGIERVPRPFVLQRSLQDFYIQYEINAYTRRPNEMVDLYGRLHQSIQDAFRRAGVEIMSPHYRSIRDGNPSTVPSEEPNPLAD
jgi:small-conductance mechanosensitive channel